MLGGDRAARTAHTGAAIAVAAATAMLGLAVAAVGAGGGALKPATASVEIPSEQIGGVVAKCRKGRQVVSGGFSTSSFDETFATGPSIFPIHLRPTSKRALRARGFNFGQDAGGFRAHVYCSKRKLGLSVASKRSAPVPSEFAASRYGGGPGRFEAIAICARRAPELVARSRTKTLASESIGAVRASCKRGTKPVSGGFRSPLSSGDMEESARGAVPFASKRAGRMRWQARFFAIEGAPASATAIAYCAR